MIDDRFSVCAGPNVHCVHVSSDTLHKPVQYMYNQTTTTQFHVFKLFIIPLRKMFPIMFKLRNCCADITPFRVKVGNSLFTYQPRFLLQLVLC